MEQSDGPSQVESPKRSVTLKWFLVALSAIPLVVACSDQDKVDSSSAVSSTLESSRSIGDGSVVLGSEGGEFAGTGIRVLVPAGLLANDSELSVEFDADAPPLPGEAITTGAAVYEIELADSFDGAVQISFDIDENKVGNAPPVAVYFDTVLNQWIPVDSVARGSEIVVTTDHLSFWSVISDFSYWAGDVLGIRESRPKCSGVLPNWVSDVLVVDDRNAPLLSCGEATSDGRLLLKVVNNRGYSMTLLSTLKLHGADGSAADLGQAIAAALSQARGSRIYLPANGYAEVFVDQPSHFPREPVEIRGLPDEWSAVGDMVVALLGATDLPLATGEAYYSCVLRLVDESADIGSGDESQILAGVLGALIECVDELTVELGGLASARMKRALITVDIGRYVGNLLQARVDVDNDLAYMSIILRRRAFDEIAGQYLPDVLGVDPTEEIDCSYCMVTGIVHLTHPTWGPVSVVSLFGNDGGSFDSTGGLVLVDSRGKVRWSWRGVSDLWSSLEPPADMDREGNPTETPSAIDGNGHLFFTSYLGRHSAAIVLRPTSEGFDDFGTLFGVDDVIGDILGRVEDENGDGFYEIVSYPDECFVVDGYYRCGVEVTEWTGDTYELTSPLTPIDVDDPVSVAEVFLKYWSEGNLDGMSGLYDGSGSLDAWDYLRALAEDPPPYEDLECVQRQGAAVACGPASAGQWPYVLYVGETAWGSPAVGVQSGP